VLKALATWPLPPRLYLAGVVGARLLLLVAGACSFLLLGQLLLGLDLALEPMRLASALLQLVLGSALFLAIGFCLAARSASVAATELIGNAVYYPTPIHRLKPYWEPDQKAGRDWDLPETDRAAAEVVSLPVHPALSAQDLERIVTAVNALGEQL